MKATLFFLGKGGVGKTTSSASLAFYLAEQHQKTFWASIDPAHNLWDIMGMEPMKGKRRVFKEKPLWAEEVNIEQYLKAFLEESTRKMKELYRYFEIINLEHIFNVIKYSPGMEEAAILYALKDLLEREKDKDYVVIDTPPTGLTLKIFTLPFATLHWINQLKKWREKILQRRKVVFSIEGKEALSSGTALTPEEDPVFRELERQAKEAREITQLLKNHRNVKMILVMNQDRLSLMESIRIREFLKRMSISLNLVLLNKFGLIDEREENILAEFKHVPIRKLPFINKEHLGNEELLALAEGWVEECL